MQLEFNQTSIHCLETVLQQKKRMELTHELRIPDGFPDIGRVLTTWGQVLIRSKQWQDDAIQISGGVMVGTLYAPEDGTQPRSVESWIPFQMNWNLESQKPEGPIRFVPLLASADSRCVSSRKLIFRAGLSAIVQALSPVNVEIFTPGQMPEDIQVLKKSYPMSVTVEGGEKTLLIDEELPTPEVGVQTEKLLNLTVYPEITEKKIIENKVVYKGQLHIHSVCRYLDGEIRGAEQAVQFSQFADLDRSYGPDAQTDILMAVTSLEADLAQSGIRLKCAMVAQYLVDDRILLELVQDAYSLKNDVQLRQSILEIPQILETQTETVQVEQGAACRGAMVVDARFLPEFPVIRHGGDGQEMELSGRFQLLSYDEEGIMQGSSVRWEGHLPMMNGDYTSQLVTVNPSGKVKTVMSMDEVSLSTQLQLCIRDENRTRIPMVTGIEVGAAREEDKNRPSVILARSTADALWDVAKENNSTVAAILAANGIDEGSIPEQMLLIPVL